MALSALEIIVRAITLPGANVSTRPPFSSLSTAGGWKPGSTCSRGPSARCDQQHFRAKARPRSSETAQGYEQVRFRPLTFRKSEIIQCIAEALLESRSFNHSASIRERTAGRLRRGPRGNDRCDRHYSTKTTDSSNLANPCHRGNQLPSKLL